MVDMEVGLYQGQVDMVQHPVELMVHKATHLVLADLDLAGREILQD